jgi:2'-5' RNA ligase
MRLFVGIALDVEVQRALEHYIKGLKEISPILRWSRPEQWHVTLQFLGETDESRYACIVRQLQTIHAEAVNICLAEPGFFERAGVFHIEVQPTDSLLALHDCVESILTNCGFEPEARAYSPHITLARDKGRRPSTDFKQLHHAVALQSPVSFPASFAKEFLLYQSFTEQAGPRYEVREHFSLM